MGPIVELTCEPLVGVKAEIIRKTSTGELIVSLMHSAGPAWPAGAHCQIKQHECRSITSSEPPPEVQKPTTDASPQHDRDHNLAAIFTRMPGAQYTEIRDAFWKAVEGLRSLADALEKADDSSYGEHLMNEHFTACAAIDVMSRSKLGKVL